MDRFIIISPAVFCVAGALVAFAIYVAKCASGNRPAVAGLKHTQLLGPFFARFAVWLLGPVERALAKRVSPNAITMVSLLLSLVSAIAIANGWLALAAWMYIASGAADSLDGRVARITGQQTTAGAYFDSVIDRWGELAIYAGFVWYLRGSSWMAVALLANAGAVMVSYTRARGEGLGLVLSRGAMQRPERIMLVSVGTLIAAVLATAGDPSASRIAIGVSLLVCGVASTVTAIGRMVDGLRLLRPTVDDSGKIRLSPPIVEPPNAASEGGIVVAVPGVSVPAARERVEQFS